MTPFAATVLCTAVLVLAFTTAGAAKVAAHPSMVTRAQHVGFSAGSYRVIGALELAGAASLLAGLAWRPLGTAAALGLVALLVGAVIAHLRTRAALVELVPALVLGTVAVVYLVAMAMRS